VLRVALTGNIASGKSSVVDVWRRLGAAVVDADVLAREAVAPGSPGLVRVAETFGPGVLAPDGGLDRAAMRALVFADPDARRRLEAIVHPIVARLRTERERALASAGAAIVVHDSPLLFEVGLERDFDVVVVVDAPDETRLARLVELRRIDPAEARRMIDAQLPAAMKRAAADIVIENDGSRAELEARAEAAWRELSRRASASA